jgi:hypothetical protein
MTTKKQFEFNIGILSRINIAHCAAERARMYVCDTDRFRGESTWRRTDVCPIHLRHIY